MRKKPFGRLPKGNEDYTAFLLWAVYLRIQTIIIFTINTIIKKVNLVHRVLMSMSALPKYTVSYNILSYFIDLCGFLQLSNAKSEKNKIGTGCTFCATNLCDQQKKHEKHNSREIDFGT
jgi:hypothetical protein